MTEPLARHAQQGLLLANLWPLAGLIPVLQSWRLWRALGRPQ